MSRQYVTRRVPLWLTRQSFSWRPACFESTLSRRSLHHDGRNRLSDIWAPTGQIQKSGPNHTSQLSVHELLVLGGFLRQAHSGIFHLLPLGLRVQNKIERLIDKHMVNLGASKVSLSSLSSEDLWARSGRLEGRDSEFLRLTDRKGAKYLLSPTHEEEITTIVGNHINSYKDLPLRLYQVSRKYRDEARPRGGLLRGREFLMKDLYTFDATEQEAFATYESVREAYCAFLDELRLPYLVANADSGNMGGSLSHEYHFVSNSGEDNVISCKECGYAVNEELYAGTFTAGGPVITEHTDNYLVSKDRQQLYNLVTPANSGELNLHAVKRLLPNADTSVENTLDMWKQSHESSQPEEHCITIHDPRCSTPGTQTQSSLDGQPILLTRARDNDVCPGCSHESLKVTPAVEIGHTFHLATRYSTPLEAKVTDAQNNVVPIQMGCHGIGVSRLVAAIAGLLKDDRGLNWPLAAAPFQVIITAARPNLFGDELERLYDHLVNSLSTKLPDMDFVLEDRDQRPFGRRLDEADLIGYPFIVVLGRQYERDRKVELQCRRLGFKGDIPYEDLPAMLEQLSAKL